VTVQKNSFGQVVVWAAPQLYGFEWRGDVSMNWFARAVAKWVLLPLMLPSVVGTFLYLHFVVEFGKVMWFRIVASIIGGLGAAGLASVTILLLALPYVALVYFAGKTRFFVTPAGWRVERFIAGVRTSHRHGSTADVELGGESHTVRREGTVRNAVTRTFDSVTRKVVHRLAFRDGAGKIIATFGAVLSREERQFVRNAYRGLVSGAAHAWPNNMAPWRAVSIPDWLSAAQR
jgi:hypothetical protein